MDFVETCPSCGHDKLLSPIGADIKYDNDVGTVLGKPGADGLYGLDRTRFARVEWRICEHCALIFAAHRPGMESADASYTTIFGHFERRKFDVYPLPQIYMDTQKGLSAELFEVLDRDGVFDGVKSVIQFRCNAGMLLDAIAQRIDSDEVYGLEYFEHPMNHAKQLVSDERIAPIEGTELSNPFERQEFDLVILDHCLTHAYRPRELVDFVKSLVAPGGTIVFFNEPDHGKTLADSARYPRGINFFHKQLYQDGDIDRFLPSCGLASRQLPHPYGRKWGSPYNSMLFVCKEGATTDMPAGDVQASVNLLQNWFVLNKQHVRKQWMKRPLKMLLRHVNRAAS